MIILFGPRNNPTSEILNSLELVKISLSCVTLDKRTVKKLTKN